MTTLCLGLTYFCHLPSFGATAYFSVLVRIEELFRRWKWSTDNVIQALEVDGGLTAKALPQLLVCFKSVTHPHTIQAHI